MGNEGAPHGACPGCGGALIWSTIRFHPERRTVDGVEAEWWEGLNPRCAASLGSTSHPCFEPDGGVAEPTPLAPAVARATVDRPAGRRLISA